MTVNEHLARAFNEARNHNPELMRVWIAISHRVGSKLPQSLLPMSIQRAGNIDLVLRSLEDEFATTVTTPEGPEANILHAHHLNMLAVYWVGDVYEVFRLLRDRDLGDGNAAFNSLFRELELLRVGLEKHEIPKDKKLVAPLPMMKMPQMDHDKEPYLYDKDDPMRAHIMPSGVSKRGSPMWKAIDHRNGDEFWIERRGLSDAILELWKPPNVET